MEFKLYFTNKDVHFHLIKTYFSQIDIYIHILMFMHKFNTFGSKVLYHKQGRTKPDQNLIKTYFSQCPHINENL